MAYECKDRTNTGQTDEMRQTLARLFDLALVTRPAPDTLSGGAGNDDPGTELADGNGRATVSLEGSYTVLTLYNHDGDNNADFTLSLQGNIAAQDLQIYLWDGSGWNAPAIIF